MAEIGLTRREFLILSARLGLIGGGVALLASSPGWLRFVLNRASGDALAAGPSALAEVAPEARYWVSLATAAGQCNICHGPNTDLDQVFEHPEGLVKCLLCANECAIPVGERGRCRVRENVDGRLLTLVYGRPASIHVDPIEKKPFYHFLPGASAYSLSTAGCPLRCKFCQNWEISQASPEDFDLSDVSPQRIVLAAENQQAPVIAFTYNEPTVFFEYMVDIAREGRSQGLRGVLISCGFMNPDPLSELCETLDAIKVDLKGFSEEFYHNVCNAELRPVLRTIKAVADSGTHLEIVNLVVPTLNDSEKDLTGLCNWVANELGPDVPVHFTRFHPDYRLLNLPPTPVSTLEHARDIALSYGLHYPYVGNVPGHPGNNTYCPNCGKMIIERSGFLVISMHLKNGLCEYCQTPIAGVWS
jgi:pyruvate formate lyase activating enzyme